jgi:hypothetical protein
MTLKENIVAGRRVVVNNRNNGKLNSHVAIMPEHGDGLRSFLASDGMILTILAAPKRDKNGINCVKISYEGEKVGYVYYTHMRYSTEEI